MNQVEVIAVLELESPMAAEAVSRGQSKFGFHSILVSRGGASLTMKLKKRNSKDRQSPPTRCGRVMKQQKLNFFTNAKRRSIVDSESHANNNKKQKLVDGKEDDNNNNNNGELKPKRLPRSCNKENFEPKSEGSELDIIQTAREGKDGKGKKLSESTNIVGGHRDQNKTREDENKRMFKSESENKKNKEETSKKSEKAKNKDKGDDEKNLDAEQEDVAEQIFSNSMKDAVKTECRICR